ncbi:sarcoplasmic reticulum histidine-rich calcium-binding protein-like [Anopheles bellator]|uniref:sarcoplasmic reticulum histidine-rich calcium-binding protein-like n=1 Tax=Anopheles bellator TaxID=139047 RepID=UPI00264A1968|nr:sarcoplasmic reticulum histidine-rich calcium-binding protein-like [Anopheles bellator]
MVFVGIVLAVSLGTTQTSPVPAKVLAKYVLSLQRSPHEGLDEPHDLDISNGLESAESVYEPVRYRQPAFQEDPYHSAHHQEQLQQHYHHHQQQQYDDQEPEDEPDYGEADSETASANHAYMTTYKTATRHGGGRGYGSSYGDSSEDEDTSASEESPAVYEPIRAHKAKGKKHGSGGSSGASSYSHNHHYYTTHHHQQAPPKGSGHTSYHPQLIQAYKILHGTGGRLPTSHEYEDDRGSEEHRHHHVEDDDDDDDDEDFRSGAAIGAAAGATGYGGPTGPQVIHTKGRAIPISQHVEIDTPIPVPYVKKIHVPIPQEVKVRIPHPVLVPIPRPYPVHIPVSQPIAVPDIKEITVPIEKVVPYPVEKKIPVPIEKPVPYPIEKHVPVYLPHPIAVRVPIVKTIIHKVKQQTASGPTLPPAGGTLW